MFPIFAKYQDGFIFMTQNYLKSERGFVIEFSRL